MSGNVRCHFQDLIRHVKKNEKFHHGVRPALFHDMRRILYRNKYMIQLHEPNSRSISIYWIFIWRRYFELRCVRNSYRKC